MGALMKKKILISILVVFIGVAAYFAYDKFFVFHLPEEKEVSSAVIQGIEPLTDKYRYKIKINKDEAKDIYHIIHDELKQKIKEMGRGCVATPSSEVILFYNDKGTEILKLYVKRGIDQSIAALPQGDYEVDNRFGIMIDTLAKKYKK